MRSLQKIDRDIAAMRKDEQAYAHTKGHRFSPIVDDELDDLYAERMATLKALGDAGLKSTRLLSCRSLRTKTASVLPAMRFMQRIALRLMSVAKKYLYPNLPGMV